MWVLLDEEATEDYNDGLIAPLDVRETAQGIEVWMPHEWQYGWLSYTKTCARCGLLPLDYDGIEVPCEREDEDDV